MPHTSDEQLLQAFEQRCLALFSQVAAVKPQKGIAALLKRAYKEIEANPTLTLEQALNDQYAIAERLTGNRLTLLGKACKPY